MLSEAIQPWQTCHKQNNRRIRRMKNSLKQLHELFFCEHICRVTSKQHNVSRPLLCSYHEPFILSYKILTSSERSVFLQGMSYISIDQNMPYSKVYWCFIRPDLKVTPLRTKSEHKRTKNGGKENRREVETNSLLLAFTFALLPMLPTDHLHIPFIGMFWVIPCWWCALHVSTAPFLFTSSVPWTSTQAYIS